MSPLDALTAATAAVRDLGERAAQVNMRDRKWDHNAGFLGGVGVAGAAQGFMQDPAWAQSFVQGVGTVTNCAAPQGSQCYSAQALGYSGPIGHGG